MNTLKKTLTAVSVSAAISAMMLVPTGYTAAATGDTDIDITLDGIVILHYFSAVDITLDSTALLAQLGLATDSVDEGPAGGTGTNAPGTVTLDLGMNPSGTAANLSALSLVLENAWAVRALNASGDNVRLEITIAVGAEDIKHDTAPANYITMSSPTVEAPTVAAAAIIEFPSPGLATPVTGDVNLTLDLTNATLSGNYNVDGRYTLTATLF